MDSKKLPLVVTGLAAAGVVLWFLLRRTGTSDEGLAEGQQLVPPPADEPAQDPETVMSEATLGQLLAEDAAIGGNRREHADLRRWGPLVARYAFQNLPKRYPIDPDSFARLILAHINRESYGRPDALGDQGYAYGLMQINIARGNNPEFAALPRELRFDPDVNVEYGSRLLASLLDLYAKRLDVYSTMRAASSAYNAGAGAVNRAIAAGRDPVTRTHQGYTDKVFASFEQYGGVLPVDAA